MIRISINGLFSRGSHEIEISDDGLAIIIGPNGSGKTTILKIINYFFSKEHMKLSNVEFTDLKVDIKDHSIKIYRKKNDKGMSYLEYYLDDKKVGKNSKNNRDELYKYIRRYGVTRHYEKNEQMLYFDDSISEEELIYEIYDHLSEEEKSKLILIPELIIELIKDTKIVYITANRLQKLEINRDKRRYRDDIRYMDTVRLYSEELKNNLQKELTKYANISQKLDETFPQKVIESLKNKHSDIKKLNVSLIEDVKNTRQKHINSGMLESNNLEIQDSYEDEFEIKEIAKVLNLYYGDMKQKLDVLNPISDKITLYLKLLNNKFMIGRKEVLIDINKGIVCYKNRGEENEKIIDLKSLSSGEQQEIVMLYDLIFKVNSGDIVLIDEPEISLHVGWQRQFLNDINSIMKVNRFNIVIATHSPQIIGDRIDGIVNLGSVE